MRKRNYIILALCVLSILFIIQSCIHDTNKTAQCKAHIDQEIHDSLSKYLSIYIEKVEPYFEQLDTDQARECAYYNVLFFEKGNIDYFMFFTWILMPEFFEFSKNKHLFLYRIKNKRIVFIDKSVGFNPLFSKTVKSIIDAQREIKVEEACWIHDGSKYPETYRYSVDGEKVLIEKADSLFYKSVVGERFANFEDFFITLPNGYRKDTSIIYN